MPRLSSISLTSLGTLVMVAASQVPSMAAQGQDRTAAAGGGGVRLVRSTSGSRGAQQGTRYVIEDPRTVFSPDTDRQVIVYFEWEGRPGTHQCEARWKDPTGKVVLVSPIEYQAPTRRFGIYWTLTLPDKAARGLWALETTVDGQPGGTHTFEIGTTADASAAPVRPILSSAEIYKRALAAMATVEALGKSGEVMAKGPAVAFDADHVIAGFPTIDGAESLRVRTPTGRVLATSAVAGFNRRVGWVVVPAAAHGLQVLPRSDVTLTIGDRFFLVHTGDDGGQVITEGAVVGQEQTSPARLRLNELVAAGSPLLDDRGDLVGLAVGRAAEELAGPARMAVDYAPVRTANANLAVAAPQLPAAVAAPVTMAELARRGEFLTPLSADRRHVISGVFAGRVERSGAVPMPLDQKGAFSRREGQASVFVQWDPREKKDVLSWFEVYDTDYKMIGRGDSVKMKLRPGRLLFSTWTLNLPALTPALYRVDLMVDGAPVWRGYLRVTE